MSIDEMDNALDGVSEIAFDDGIDDDEVAGGVAFAPADRDPDGDVGLFDGDNGSLDLRVRQAFVTLLRQRHISELSHPNEWRTVLENRDVLSGRLHDMFIDLVVDDVIQVAYKRQVRVDGIKMPTLLPASKMNAEQTALLLHLRTLMRATAVSGDALFVDRDDLLAHIANMRPLHVTNEVEGDRSASRAIDALADASVLIKVHGDDQRYRVSPIVEALLPVATIDRLTQWLSSHTPTTDDGGNDDEEA